MFLDFSFGEQSDYRASVFTTGGGWGPIAGSPVSWKRSQTQGLTQTSTYFATLKNSDGSSGEVAREAGLGWHRQILPIGFHRGTVLIVTIM
jgi:hypothetical protein